MKLSIEVIAFKPFARGSLVGFCHIRIDELKLKVSEVAIHEKGPSRWAQMPARAWLKDGIAIRDDSGKIQYSPLFEFETREVRDAFSREVWRAFLAFDAEVVS